MQTSDHALLVDRVIGSRNDPVYHDRIHALEHRHAVEIVMLPAADLARRRLLAKTRGGRDVAIALPRDQRLFDGAILLLDDAQAIVVHAEAERWMSFKPRSVSDAIELGYHAGNLHWRVRFDGDALLVPLESRVEDYTARLGTMVSDGRVTVDVIAAPGHPLHSHHHDHANAHAVEDR